MNAVHSGAVNKHAVVIAGGGPTGMTLAGELALAGIDVAIVERRANQDIIGQRAGGLHARTIEVFDQRGIADRFLAAGQPMQVAGFAMVRLSIEDLPTRHNYGLALRQRHIERVLAEWIGELGVPIYRKTEVTGFTQDDEGVDVRLSSGASLRAQYLVGCDGGRSLVRKAAGIEFPGSDATTSAVIAEAKLADEPKEWGIKRTAAGINALSKLEDSDLVGILVTEPSLERAGEEATLNDLRAGLLAAYGTDFGVHNPLSISRFTDTARQAATYRKGRVLLAGDAAHIHPPEGGQGLNIGVQDAVNLGWKLAQVVQGTSPESLLDTYHAERHPVGARVLRNTMAQVVMRKEDDRTGALRQVLTELLSMEEPRKRYAAMQSGLDVHYDLGAGHALLGRRMPDLDLITSNGPVRVYTLLHKGRPVLINCGKAVDMRPWADRVPVVDAKYEGKWELPAIGTVPTPSAVLVRPDGYVAWVGDGSQVGLTESVTKWFGAPRSA